MENQHDCTKCNNCDCNSCNCENCKCKSCSCKKTINFFNNNFNY